MARPVGEINAGSMADIAFLLLIFFLVTTTMDQESGLQRRLPPIAEKKQTADKVNKRNILVVKINQQDRLLAGGQILDIGQLQDKVVEFITNPYNDENLPEKEKKQIENFGAYDVSKGLISLQNDRGTSYAAYIEVQNELVKAVNKVRDDFAMQKWGKKYANLDETHQKIVKDCIPQNISEAEPKDTSKK